MAIERKRRELRFLISVRVPRGSPGRLTEMLQSTLREPLEGNHAMSISKEDDSWPEDGIHLFHIPVA